MSTPQPAAAGPSATEAQAASRYNAVKHGIVAVHQIMFDESVEDLAELAAEYHQHHTPADPDQRFLVDTLIANEWRLRRMRRVEAVLWEHAADAFLAQHPEAEACNSAHAFTTNSGYFERLQRMANGCERNYHRALKELQHLQAKVGQALPPANVPADPGPLPQKAAAEPPQPQQSTTTSAKLASVWQNPKAPPPAAPKQPGATPLVSPLAGPHASASPAKTRSGPPDLSPNPMEAPDQGN
jgi:hypothetical protein